MCGGAVMLNFPLARSLRCGCGEKGFPTCGRLICGFLFVYLFACTWCMMGGGPWHWGCGGFSTGLVGSVMFDATFNLVARVGLPWFLEQGRMMVFGLML